jgi:hypothetical protein
MMYSQTEKAVKMNVIMCLLGRLIYECRCDERLKAKDEGSTLGLHADPYTWSTPDCEGKRVYYESIKREPKIRGIKKCRCDERLQTKTKEFTRLPGENALGKKRKKI